MTKEQFYLYQQQTFDSFAKKVIRNKSIDILREYSRRAEREVSLSEMPISDILGMSINDTYRTYCKIYNVRGNIVRIYDPDIGEVLQHITPQRRDVILLGFFMDYNDSEIGKLLSIDHRTVKYRRSAALRRLRELMEDKENE